ncbi:MAG: SGNH/GDSL hydrolase family protein [bacterium]
MAELLIKLGDNFPHKDLMLSLRSSDAGAKSTWIEREAEKYAHQASLDQRIAIAENSWHQKKHAGYREGDIIIVRPDGWQWGARESFPRFLIARISDKELFSLGFRWSIYNEQRQMFGLQTPLLNPSFDPAALESGDNPLYLHKRAFHLKSIDKLKPGEIIEIPVSLLSMKEGYAEYEPSKALPHNSAGTYTIRAAGGSYTSLSSWETGEQCDLTGQGPCIAECYNDWANGLDDILSISGWTATASDYIKVYAPTGQRHDGTVDGTGFLLTTTTNAHNIQVGEANTIIDGIKIKGQTTQTYKSAIIVISGNGNNSKIINNLIYRWGNTSTTWNSAIMFSGTAANTFNGGLIANNIVLAIAGIGARGGQGGIIGNLTADDYQVYNNTVLGFSGTGSIGIRVSGDSTHYKGDCQNNVAMNCALCFSTLYSAHADYNCSSDNTAAGAHSLTNKIASNQFADLTYGQEDVHIKDINADIYDAGNDLSGIFTADIDGNIRTRWDIGADEYSAAAGHIINYLTNIINTSLTSSIPVSIHRSLLANITGQSLTSDVSISTPHDIAYSANILGISTTPDLSIASRKVLSYIAHVLGISGTANIELEISRVFSLTANILGSSNTSVVDFTQYDYNGLHRWIETLTFLKNGGSGLFHLCFVGDSITTGGVAGNSYNDFRTLGFAGYVRSHLGALFGDVGLGFIPVHYAGPYPAFTFSGTWGLQGGYGVVACEKSNETGATASVNFAGTGIGIVTAKLNTGAQFTVSIDGGTPVVFDTYNATTINPFSFEITGLPDTNHTAIITVDNAAYPDRYLYLIGIYPIRGTCGIRVHTCARYGARAGDLSYCDGCLDAEISLYAPVLTVIALCANDYNMQTDLATYKANLSLIADKALLYGDCLILIDGIFDTVKAIPQSAYEEICREVAAEKGCALLDSNKRWHNSIDYARSMGFLADDVHPSVAGHADIGAFLLDFLLSSAREHEFTATIQGISNTSEIAFRIFRNLLAHISGQSITGGISLDLASITRDLIANIAGQSFTPEILVRNILRLSFNNTSLSSYTPIQTIESMNPVRTIEII